MCVCVCVCVDRRGGEWWAIDFWLVWNKNLVGKESYWGGIFPGGERWTNFWLVVGLTPPILTPSRENPICHMGVYTVLHLHWFQIYDYLKPLFWNISLHHSDWPPSGIHFDILLFRFSCRCYCDCLNWSRFCGFYDFCGCLIVLWVDCLYRSFFWW